MFKDDNRFKGGVISVDRKISEDHLLITTEAPSITEDLPRVSQLLLFSEILVKFRTYLFFEM